MKANGFTLIEVIVASAILMSVITTIVPIISTLNKEQQRLSDRRIIVHTLHDEMQPFLWSATSETSSKFTKNVNDQQVAFQFANEDHYLKGCAIWQNVKYAEETICLYGIHAS
ncbi:hypothetical protein CWR48_09080 [Oceanobacillus arenosus]|uniref:Prepilin-type cleavage/methylation domain-containing protein n=1 Tax=Oceanobacillus arenosus TaxID=1229153 RepID=A0A3D8PTZ9_9BACI|nr:type II secretion system protein [Oceanobacillus arenosus]RDW19192.1 hypothetical protein CWR48_09080 [Oceanobacillus arenosus]